MAEALAFMTGAWLTAKAIDALASFFTTAAAGVVIEWMQGRSEQDEGIKEESANERVHVEFVRQQSLASLSKSINELKHESQEGTKAVLRAIMEITELQQDQQQRDYLRRAVNKMNDVIGGMHPEGDPDNVELLKTASQNAEEAARMGGNFSMTLQAYRLWVVTQYMYMIVRVNGNSSQAKNTVKYILKKIFHEKNIQGICQQFSRHRSRNDLEVPKEVRQKRAQAMEFLFDITSSVSMLPPLDDKLIEADDNGKLTMTLEVPNDVIFAMGRYCDTINPDLTRTYPDVSALALKAWDAGKEKLALDSFFESMRGYKWSRSRGWRDVWVDLGDRFGVTTDKNGHVIRIHLASNNLQGALNNDLADCEHLRELILHGNCITGEIPPRLQALIDDKPGMLVSGLHDKVTPSSEIPKSAPPAKPVPKPTPEEPCAKTPNEKPGGSTPNEKPGGSTPNEKPGASTPNEKPNAKAEKPKRKNFWGSKK